MEGVCLRGVSQILIFVSYILFFEAGASLRLFCCLNNGEIVIV